jgi:tetratricopeptide (TPR) repeat protein
MVAIPEQGLLAEVPFPRLLVDLYRARFSGAVTLSRDRIGKRFLFHQGVPVFAESNLASESLGVQLMDQGRITRPDYAKVTTHIEKKKCKEGTALLELGLLEPKDLFLALKDQIRIRLIECFGWPQGHFQVDPTAEPSADAQPFRANVLALLQEGLETHWNTDRILTDLTPHLEHYPVRAGKFEALAAKLDADPTVDALIEALDGRSTFWKALQAGGRSPRALAAAWVLDALDVLEFRDEPAAVETEAEPEAAPEPELEIVVDNASRPSGRHKRSRRARERMGSGRNERKLAESIQKEIDDKHERLDALNAYELLDVLPEADDRTIRKAYLQAAKRYHPDALARMGFDAELRERANRVFAEIGKAHKILSNATQRQGYDAALRSNDTDLDANRLAQAETLYRKGEILLRAGNFRGALEFLEPAVELWPEEPAYQNALAWALYKRSPSDPERAREHLEHAHRLDPRDTEVLFRLGVVMRATGDAEEGERLMNQAQELDPRAH